MVKLAGCVERGAEWETAVDWGKVPRRGGTSFKVRELGKRGQLSDDFVKCLL